MGYGRWDSTAWATTSANLADKSQSQIFTKHGMDDALDPSKIKTRESVDSENNPNTTPIIIACDETGSMGYLAELIIKTGLGKVMQALYDHRPVSDPQVLMAGVGDAYSDRAPLQVTQFESEVQPLVDQIQKIFIESNGGSNRGESYALTWLFAMYKTTCDAIIKRKRKGYLFTIGDESPHPVITREQVTKIFGVGCEGDVQAKDLLKEISPFWHVFHIVVNPVAYQPVVHNWYELLGQQRVILLEDHARLPEVITAVIRLTEGQTLEPSTALVVRSATQHLVSQS